ncbi:DUF2507 domain-containing protein [Furfurilactobacillus siliginis]|uniref:Hydrocarbon-binding protein n=1 Tax=Furfurilactobacillus siliginis TaxID=348151 RepID=A0A0R2L8J6_9LACO|nr:DUF2507 domain-containing protein [Furfurilactobacillus siliginis]KRN95434.1 hypothetical protein IV55_GL001894 [Furfurilactobacillus siliginis]GEK28205.1 hydrocarbon-binding protein [Furfurilactobacillus siliginis]
MDQATYAKLLKQTDVTALGASFMRDEVLPVILGSDQVAILYWIGRQVARNNPLANETSIVPLFKQLNFGDLHQTKQTRHQQFFELTGTAVLDRLAAYPDANYDFEAGFLAQEIEIITGAATEGTVDEIHKDGVSFIIQTDPKDIVGDVAASVPTLTVRPQD